MDVFAKLGIDWKLLLAQAVNFGILFFILRRYAYQPMLDFLEKRSNKIEAGLKDAEAATRKLVEMEQKEKEVLAAARTEGKEMIALAEASAKKRDAERMAETEARAAKFLADAEKQITEEKEKALAEAKSEIAELVSAGVEKLLKEKMDAATDKKVIEQVTR